MWSTKVCFVQRTTYSVSRLGEPQGSGADLKRGPSPWNRGTAASCSETHIGRAFTQQLSGVSDQSSDLSLSVPRDTRALPLSHMGRQTNRWTSGPRPGLIHPETPSSLETQQGCSEEGDRERQRGRTLLATEPGRRTDCSQTRGCRDKRPRGRGRFSHRTPGSERPAGTGAGQLPARVRLGARALPAGLLSRCAQESLLRNTRGYGHGHSADHTRPPQTRPSEAPSCISNKLPLVTLTHTDA